MKSALLFFLLISFSNPCFGQSNENEIDPSNSPLMLAVKKNNLAEVKKLVLNGAIINEETERGWNDAPVDVAVRSNYKEIALFLLEKGATSRKYFYSAVYNGDVLFVTKLLNYGYEDSEAVLAAVESKKLEMVELLVQKGFPVNFSQKRRTGLFRKEYVSPLEVALDQRQVKMVLALVNAGAPITDAFAGACSFSDLELGYLILEKKTRLDELHYLAVENGNSALARKAKAYGANVNYVDKEGLNCIQTAVKNGDESMIHYCLDECKLSLNSKTSTGENCWMLAAESKNVSLFQEMIQRPDFDINATNNAGRTVLFFAANSANQAILESLLPLKPDVNRQDNEGLTAPMLVLWNRFNAQFTLLKQLPINYALVSNDGVDLLGYFVASGSYTIPEIEEMVANGCDPKRKDKYGVNLAYHAIEMESLPLLEKLKAWGASVDPENKNGNRPDKRLNKEITQFIFAHGAKIDRQSNTWYETYLESAMKQKDIELFVFFLRSNANPNQKTHWNKTILFECIQEEYIDFLKILLQFKVDLQMTDSWGKNALEQAIESKNTAAEALLRSAGAKTKSEFAAYEVKRNQEIVQIRSYIQTKNLAAIQQLFNKYPDIHLSESDRNLVAVMAIQQENLEMIRILFDKGLYATDVLNFEQQTLAHIAAKEGKLDLLKLFINKGADPKAKDAFDKTPLNYAKTKEIKTYLKSIKN